MSGYARLKVRGLLTKSNRKKFLQRPMKATKRTATSLTFPFALFAFLNMALAADNRLPWAPSALHWFAPGSYFSTPRRMSVCASRKLDSAILMMKAAKDRLGCDGADALNRPMERGILVQLAMNARFIIISGKLAQDPAQVRLPEHDHVVETFPSDRADQSLDVRVLPRRLGRDRLCPQGPGGQTPHQKRARARVPG